MNDTERLRERIRQVNHGGIDADGSTDTDRLVTLVVALLDEARLHELNWCAEHWLDTKAYSARIAALTQKQEN